MKIKTVQYVFLKTFIKTFMTVPKCITEMHDGNKYNLRTIEAQTVQKLKNKKARSKFTGSYKKSVFITSCILLSIGISYFLMVTVFVFYCV